MAHRRAGPLGGGATHLLATDEPNASVVAEQRLPLAQREVTHQVETLRRVPDPAGLAPLTARTHVLPRERRWRSVSQRTGGAPACVRHPLTIGKLAATKGSHPSQRRAPPTERASSVGCGDGRQRTRAGTSRLRRGSADWGARRTALGRRALHVTRRSRNPGVVRGRTVASESENGSVEWASTD